jgi:hypothetical protein
MSCAFHASVEHVDVCSLCARPLCEACLRRVEEAAYCVPCLVERLKQQDPPEESAPPPDEPAVESTEILGGENPGAAFALGMIPGVGAIYNAEYFKAAVHLVIFAMLISISDAGGWPGEILFGMLAFGFYVYMPFEAYYTAKRRQKLRQGIRLETPFDQINEAFDEIEDKEWWGGVGLVVFGGLFLLGNFGILELVEVFRLWPALLVVLGIWMLKRFHQKES